MSLYEDLADDSVTYNALANFGDSQTRDHMARVLRFYKDVSLSAAQMDALNATPVSMIAAPGAGKIILLDEVFCINSFGATAFEIGTGAVDFRYQNSSGGQAATLPTAFVEAAATAYYVAKGLSVTALTNQAIVAHASQDVTAGDGALYMRIFFRVLRHSEMLS